MRIEIRFMKLSMFWVLSFLDRFLLSSIAERKSDPVAPFSWIETDTGLKTLEEELTNDAVILHGDNCINNNKKEYVTKYHQEHNNVKQKTERISCENCQCLSEHIISIKNMKGTNLL